MLIPPMDLFFFFDRFFFFCVLGFPPLVPAVQTRLFYEPGQPPGVYGALFRVASPPPPPGSQNNWGSHQSWKGFSLAPQGFRNTIGTFSSPICFVHTVYWSPPKRTTWANLEPKWLTKLNSLHYKVLRQILQIKNSYYHRVLDPSSADCSNHFLLQQAFAQVPGLLLPSQLMSKNRLRYLGHILRHPTCIEHHLCFNNSLSSLRTISSPFRRGAPRAHWPEIALAESQYRLSCHSNNNVLRPKIISSFFQHFTLPWPQKLDTPLHAVLVSHHKTNVSTPSVSWRKRNAGNKLLPHKLKEPRVFAADM